MNSDSNGMNRATSELRQTSMFSYIFFMEYPTPEIQQEILLLNVLVQIYFFFLGGGGVAGGPKFSEFCLFCLVFMAAGGRGFLPPLDHLRHFNCHFNSERKG